jgi:hypothetical protein
MSGSAATTTALLRRMTALISSIRPQLPHGPFALRRSSQLFSSRSSCRAGPGPQLTGHGHHRQRGRVAPSCPPAATSSCQFRPPHPAGGQSNTGVATHGVADATFDGGFHDPAEFNWSQDPYDEDDDDVQEIEETVRLLVC